MKYDSIDQFVGRKYLVRNGIHVSLKYSLSNAKLDSVKRFDKFKSTAQ